MTNKFGIDNVLTDDLYPVPGATPFGAPETDEITEDELRKALLSVRVSSIKKAFSRGYFTIPDGFSYGDEGIAAQLVRGLHCVDYKHMSSETKILLYRAALKVMDVAPADFPYPFMAELKTVPEVRVPEPEWEPNPPAPCRVPTPSVTFYSLPRKLRWMMVALVLCFGLVCLGLGEMIGLSDAPKASNAYHGSSFVPSREPAGGIPAGGNPLLGVPNRSSSPAIAISQGTPHAHP